MAYIAQYMEQTVNRMKLLAVMCLFCITSQLNAQASTVILVRHAEKSAPSGDVDISDAGKVRAGELAHAPALSRIDAVFVTEYRRTRQTGDSAAALHHLTPTVIATQGDPKLYAAAVAAAVRKLPAGSVALVVGHSNTAAAVIAALGGPTIADMCDSEYATMYVLELSGTPAKLTRASYGAADKPDPACPTGIKTP
jgi:broad specificity phosphatase PhoE